MDSGHPAGGAVSTLRHMVRPLLVSLCGLAAGCVGLALALPVACSAQADGASSAGTGATHEATGAPSDELPRQGGEGKAAVTTVRVDGYEIVERYDHDRRSYTQGLVYHEGHLYESTGRQGESRVREWVPETGKVVLDQPLEYALFGEGLALWKGTLIQLTWKNGVAIVYDLRSLAELARHSYQGEGWGLCSDGSSLVMSNGSSKLLFRDPQTFAVQRELEVTFLHPDTRERTPLADLNELEVIRGEIWANVYQEDLIARIDPETGEVRSWIDLTGLQAKQGVRDPTQEVLNGIAYDAEGDRIFITGKYWPNLYQIRVVER